MAVNTTQIISGAEWDALSRKDKELAGTERVIFARMTPEHKVQTMQKLERSVRAGVRDGRRRLQRRRRYRCCEAAMPTR